MYPTDEETRLWVELNLAQRAAYRAMETTLKNIGLPPLRWYDLLWALERAGEEGLWASELEVKLLFEQSNLSRLIHRMIEEGLILESVCPEDRRAKTLRISEEGRATRRRMWEIYGPLIHAFMVKVDAGDRERLTTALQRLRSEA